MKLVLATFSSSSLLNFDSAKRPLKALSPQKSQGLSQELNPLNNLAQKF